jgi:hypothetical protein
MSKKVEGEIKADRREQQRREVAFRQQRVYLGILPQTITIQHLFLLSLSRRGVLS